MGAPIKITRVTKYYQGATVPAVNNISLAIKSGEVYGLLGANGAGKTTTIRMILDFIRPSSGTIQVIGKDTRTHGTAIRAHIGYLPGDVVLPKDATGNEFLSYLRQLSGHTDKGYMESLASRFEAQLDKKMCALSKGNRQKIGVIQAFMHQPDVLVLDEPTSGLDPLMQEQFYKLINESRERGAAVLLSSHSIDEVTRMCDQIGIIRNGSFAYEGSAADILSKQKPQWRVTFKNASAISHLSKDPALQVLSTEGTTITVQPSVAIEKALAALSHYAIVSMTTMQRGLEDEFMRFYEQGEQA